MFATSVFPVCLLTSSSDLVEHTETVEGVTIDNLMIIETEYKWRRKPEELRKPRVKLLGEQTKSYWDQIPITKIPIIVTMELN